LDGSTKDFQQLKHAIKPYCMMFKEIDEGKKEAATNHNVSATKRKTPNKYENIAFFLGGAGVVNYFQIFAFCWVLEPNLCEQ
jgi:hypothetical protein